MKNWIIVLLIFIVPLGLYGFLEAAHGERLFSVSKKEQAMVYKFSSPMCADCRTVEKHIKSIKTQYPELIVEDIDVTQKNRATKDLIAKYNVTIVPTLIFVDKEGNIVEKLESDIEKSDIERCVKKIVPHEVKK